MAKNLYKVLTAYGATPVYVDHPTTPKSGDPCRWGGMVGVALIDEEFGYGSYLNDQGLMVNYPYDPINNQDYADGKTPVSFQQNIWTLTVWNATGSAVGPGDLVVYRDASWTGAAGYIGVASDPTVGDATVGVIWEGTVPIQLNAEVQVMLLPGMMAHV